MRKVSTVIGLTVLALSVGAKAQDGVPAASPAAAVSPGAAPPPPAAAIVAPVPDAPPAPLEPAPRSPRPMELALSLVPMGLGTYTTPIGGLEASGDASFAYGFGLSWSYRVIAGLNVGLAPQAIYNVKYKVFPSEIGSVPAATQYDFMARVGYEFALVDGITLYIDALPGYSIIAIPGTSPAKGLVFAAEAGVSMDLSDRVFLKIGGGYEWGFQKVNLSGTSLDNKTSYVRAALGGGVRF